MKCSWDNFNVVFNASISDKELDELKNANQHFSDCYLMTTVEAMSNIKNGRNILKRQIQYDDNNPKVLNCYLYNSYGKKEKYSIPTNAVVEGYEKLYNKQKNQIIRSLDISVAEYEKKHKEKPLVCRITDTFKNYEFENNLPSHFMTMLTGKTPTVNIAETEFNLDLTKHREEVLALFRRMQTEKDYCMVIATGMKVLDGRTWHVYMIQDVNLDNNTITVKEKRSNKPKTMDIDTAINTFKYIVGYFDSDLK